jgi:hypothetical protein
MGSKSRQFWGYSSISEDNWKRIFGHTETRIEHSIKKLPKDVPCRNDYELCRDCDKPLKDYIKHKNVNDRKKIMDEYYGRQKYYRDNKVKESVFTN